LGKYLHAESPFRATKEIKTYSLYAIIVSNFMSL